MCPIFSINILQGEDGPTPLLFSDIRSGLFFPRICCSHMRSAAGDCSGRGLAPRSSARTRIGPESSGDCPAAFSHGLPWPEVLQRGLAGKKPLDNVWSNNCVLTYRPSGKAQGSFWSLGARLPKIVLLLLACDTISPLLLTFPTPH